MAVIKYHGGSCCGIRHIHAFTGHETAEDIERLMKSASVRHGKATCILVEVVLTNSQCKKKDGYLPALLQQLGFKLVTRFKNINSGNICNVFHYVPAPLSTRSRAPFTIIQPETT